MRWVVGFGAGLGFGFSRGAYGRFLSQCSKGQRFLATLRHHCLEYAVLAEVT